MRGWTPDGAEVDLCPWQALLVRALPDREQVTLPSRGRGLGWPAVLATAGRLDATGRALAPLTAAEIAQVPTARDDFFRRRLEEMNASLFPPA